MNTIETFNGQSMGEEIANAISHGIGALLAVAGTVIVIVKACLASSGLDIVSASLYGFSLILLYLCSTLYHSITNRTAKRVFQTLDHCSIFLLILGSYIPLCLSMLGGNLGWTLFSINAFCTVVGVALNAISVKRFHKYSLVLYLVMGWSIMFLIRPVIERIPTPGLLLLIAGGLAYSVGVIFYKAKRPRFMHSVWHLFVLLGSVLHYFMILFYIIG